jgi:DnaJ-class molecular chaperone
MNKGECPVCKGKGYEFNKDKGYEEECFLCEGTGVKEYD